MNGKFIISLDFELMWGVRDKKTKEQYGSNVIGVHKVIPRLLQSFKAYGIKGTFSIVGFLFFKNKEHLNNNLPQAKPQYNESILSPYNGYIDTIGSDSNVDLYHYAPSLIELIKMDPEQEIGTHTFSHYYCLEDGQTVSEFKEDLKCAIHIAKENGVVLTSLIFPRNQFNSQYLEVCNELGILCYRGNEHSWLYTAKNAQNESLFRRCCRLIDAYINISGHNCYTDELMRNTIPINIPSSRFLRPYIKKLNFLDGLRLQRIKSGMTAAAKQNLTYHLWWHPHNFGINQKENFAFLEKILAHYKLLNNQYNFQSYTMTDLAKHLKNG